MRRLRRAQGEMDAGLLLRAGAALQTRAGVFPKELQELAARVDRPRDRPRRGDSTMTADSNFSQRPVCFVAECGDAALSGDARARRDDRRSLSANSVH